jgi:hypothetical protein
VFQEVVSGMGHEILRGGNEVNRHPYWLIALEALFQYNIRHWRRSDTRATREAWAELNMIVWS